MGGTKTTTQQNTSGGYNNTNTYGYSTPPITPQIQALSDFKFTADPSIAYNTAQAKKQLASSIDNPMGANYNPAIKSAILRSGNANIDLAGSEQASEANQALEAENYAQKLQVAGITNPQLVQTGSSGTSNQSGTGTQTQSQSPWSTVGDIGSSLIMAF